MQLSNAPQKILVPFANAGTKNTIPVPSQIGITPGAASFSDGFPPLTMTPVASGGVPPYGADFNGILNAITQVQMYQSGGGMWQYDATWSTDNGGYPKGAILLKATGTGYWVNAADNNTVNPDTIGTNWVDLGAILNATTPAQFNISNAIATTAFVHGQGLQASAYTAVTTTGSLTTATCGSTIIGNSATAITQTLPTAASVPAGARIEFFNLNAGALTIQRASTDTIGLNISIAPTSITMGTGDSLTLESNGVGQWVAVGGSAQLGYATSVPGDVLQSVSATVAANALTATYNGGTLSFRNATLTTGSPSPIFCGASSLTVPNTATLGTVSGTQAILVLLELYNAGSPVLGIVNYSGGLNLDETGVISTTALSTSANANNVVYSTAAVSSSPYRVVGFMKITQTTAGTWATNPTLVQPAGGQSLTNVLGQNQTWTNVAGSRVLGTTYYNTESVPIKVSSSGFAAATSGYADATVQGVTLYGSSILNSGGGSYTTSIYFEVPPGGSYSINNSLPMNTWNELR